MQLWYFQYYCGCSKKSQDALKKLKIKGTKLKIKGTKLQFILEISKYLVSQQGKNYISRERAFGIKHGHALWFVGGAEG